MIRVNFFAGYSCKMFSARNGSDYLDSRGLNEAFMHGTAAESGPKAY